MNSRYILKGITEYAIRHLTADDIEDLNEMIDSEIERGDRDCVFILPDGGPIHANFINVKQVTKERSKT